MGNPKQKWTTEEEQALRDGVAKYGAGKWKCIHNDPAFSPVLHSRSNIDLKDKWRNLSAAAQGLTTRSRTPKPKPPQDTSAATATATPTLAPPVNIQPPPALPIPHKPATSPVVKEEPVKDIPDPKNASRLNDAMIFEALSAAKDLNGLDIVSILGCIEKKVTIESPQYFRKQLGARLRKLVSLDRLEKVENCYYRVKNRSLVETNASNRKENRSRPLMVPAHLRISESLEEAAKTAAYKVAEAEEKTYFAAMAVREAERLSKLQEESDAMLQVAQEIYDSWHNNEVLVA